ncbi:hypothetical protein llap_14573 [Limosa lapponica baueri]|uniref:Uncharacterized protein n=1 Tax=Limosa lapponica baueri TaxID=1758121 RepID=A0A2I0TMV9_LIMLA|nr:hypothetical protein llap_14573 [Limosa lapponica baueri]
MIIIAIVLNFTFFAANSRSTPITGVRSKKKFQKETRKKKQKKKRKEKAERRKKREGERKKNKEKGKKIKRKKKKITLSSSIMLKQYQLT